MALIAGVLMLAACDDLQQAVDSSAREGAKGVVAETLVTRFPQVPRELITPFTDCVIENALAVEVRDLARSAVVGVDDSTVTTVRNVLARPETQQCLQSRALNSGLI